MSTALAARRVLIPVELSPLQDTPRQGEPMRLDGLSMGTHWMVKLAGVAERSRPALQAGIQRVLDQVVAEMSHWASDSALSRFNRAPAGSWHTLPEACFAVLQAGLAVARASDGAFDPTVGALVNLWGFGPSGPRQVPPSPQEVAAAHACSGWQRLELQAAERRVRQPGGLQLDFSGIAKGYAVDAVLDYLRGLGIASALVEVGGELSGLGVKPDAQPWWVVLAQPPGSQLADTVVALHGLAMATSGDYLRHFQHAGRDYAHTLDPRSGEPLLAAPASVSVLHPRCMLADAHATAISVLGVEAGLAYAERYQLAALIIERCADGLREHLSSALARLQD
jgi:thiamine biosynthesis lipoprotein